MKLGATTLLTVTALPVRSAPDAVVVFQLAAAARLNAVASTALVPFLLSSPLTLSLSAALRVMLKAVALLVVTLALVRL